MSTRQKANNSWIAYERQTRDAFRDWAAYRLDVFRATSSTEWSSDGRVARYLQLLEATTSPEHMAEAWSSALDALSSTVKAQYLAGVLRTGESLTEFLSRINRLMQGEIGLLPAYDIPMNMDLLVESALYALYVAWSPSSKVVVPDNRKELWRAIALDEGTLRVVTPRRFEELVAFVYEQLGCRAEVTEATRDNGADVLAWQPGPFGTESLIVVQTKLYSGENKVDLAGVHALHGAVAHYSAAHGHLVATSDATGPARQFMDARGYRFIDLPTLRREVEAILK